MGTETGTAFKKDLQRMVGAMLQHPNELGVPMQQALIRYRDTGIWEVRLPDKEKLAEMRAEIQETADALEKGRQVHEMVTRGLDLILRFLLLLV